MTKTKTAAEFGAEGGKKRAKSLNSTRRSEIAREAALAKWHGNVPRATHEGPLRIGEHTIHCAVLEDGTRLLTRIDFIRAIGRRGKPKGGRKYDEESKVPVFLTASNLKPFISNDLLENSKVVYFRAVKTGGLQMGYRAELLSDVCNVFIAAQADGVLRANQEHIARQCILLNQGFAKVGITALVDEATGFQEDRSRDALAKILEAFIAKEIRKWVRTFPVEFYRGICKLRGLAFNETVRFPSYFGHLTNDLIYSRLAPYVLAELRRLNPVNDKGRRKSKHHQWLTDDIGDPRLKTHFTKVLTLMDAADDWDSFYALLNRVLPPYSKLPLLALAEEPPSQTKKLAAG